MRPTRTWWAWLTVAGLGLALAGCGGGDSSAIDEASGADAEAEAANLEASNVNPMESPPAAAPLPDQAPESAPAEAQAPAPTPAPTASASASETDQMLALANSAPVAAPPPSKTASANGASGSTHDINNPPGLTGGSSTEMAMMNAAPGMNAPGINNPPGLTGGSSAEAAMMNPGAGPGMSIPGGAEMESPDDAGGMAGDMSSGNNGNNGPGSAKEPDYKTTISGVNTFLDALKKKDTRVLAEAVAIRSEFEAETELHRNLFKAIREESLASSDLDQLAELFKDMKVVGRNYPKSTGSLGIIVGTMDKKSYEYRTRTILMRHEKMGWKVQDFSGVRVQKMPNPKTSQMYQMRQKMMNRNKR